MSITAWFAAAAAVVCVRKIDHFVNKRLIRKMRAELSPEQYDILSFLADKLQIDTLCFGESNHAYPHCDLLSLSQTFTTRMDALNFSDHFMEVPQELEAPMIELGRGKINLDRFLKDFRGTSYWTSKAATRHVSKVLGHAILRKEMRLHAADTRDTAQELLRLSKASVVALALCEMAALSLLAPVRVAFPHSWRPHWISHPALLTLETLSPSFRALQKNEIGRYLLDDRKTALFIDNHRPRDCRVLITFGLGHFERGGPYNMAEQLREHGANPFVIGIYPTQKFYQKRKRALERTKDPSCPPRRPAPIDFVMATEYGPARTIFNDKALERAFYDAYPHHRPL